MRRLTATLALLVAALAIAIWWWQDPVSPGPDAVTEPGSGGGAPTESVAPTQPSEQPDPEQRLTVQAATPAEAATPPTPTPEELWGRVVTAGTAAPIEGAEVKLLHRDADEFWNLDLDYGERVIEVGRTKSGSDGTFRFAVPRARTHKLVVRAGGFAQRTLPALTGGSEVIVELSPGATVSGVVRSGGEGLVDVPVTVNVVGESIRLASGRTAAAGEFLFTGLQPGPVFVQAKSPAHSEKWQRLVLEPGGTHRAELDLDPGTTLRGRVVDSTTGAAVIDAEVSDSWTFKRVARVDADGRFALRGLEDDGFVSIQVRSPGYASTFQNLTGKLDEEAEFRLVRGGTVFGRFVTASGAPVRSAYAAVAANYMKAPGMQGCDWIRAEIDADGRFAATGLRPELHYWLYVRAQGHGTRVHALPRRPPAGESVDLGNIVLLPAGGIEGRVVDDSEAPLAGVKVSLRGSNSDSREWLPPGTATGQVSQFNSRSARCDGNGVFRFTGVSAGTYELNVRLPGRSQAVKNEVTARDGEITTDIRIVVPTGLGIEGTIAYSDGRALGDEGADLHLSADGETGGTFSARIEPGGSFAFQGLSAGTYTVSVLESPDGWSLAPSLGVQAGTKDLRLVFERSSFVAGQVFDAEGKGTKAHVWARPEGFQGGSALHPTDDEGRFRVEVPPSFRGAVGAYSPAEWQISAKLEGIVAGQSELRLSLSRDNGPSRGR